MTVTELRKKLRYFNAEIGCTGTTTASHSYPSEVIFWLEGGVALKIKEMEPRTHAGCGCWNGIDIYLERDDDNSVDVCDGRRGE